MKSNIYSEDDIFNLNSYEKLLEISRIIENDFINFIDNLGLNEEEKQILKILFYKYGDVSYEMRDREQ